MYGIKLSNIKEIVKREWFHVSIISSRLLVNTHDSLISRIVKIKENM